MKSEIPCPELRPAEEQFTQRSTEQFTEQFSATRRGARLARLAAARRLACWGWPQDGDTNETAALLVAELASNAVRHGRVPGRDFRLHLAVRSDPRGHAVLRIAVCDARGDARPYPPKEPAPDAETGRGMLLVEALADRWGVADRDPVGKTVWCELSLPRSGRAGGSGGPCLVEQPLPGGADRARHSGRA